MFTRGEWSARYLRHRDQKEPTRSERDNTDQFMIIAKTNFLRMSHDSVSESVSLVHTIAVILSLDTLCNEPFAYTISSIHATRMIDELIGTYPAKAFLNLTVKVSSTIWLLISSKIILMIIYR